MLASSISAHEQSFIDNKTDTSGNRYTLTDDTYGSVLIVKAEPESLTGYFYEEEHDKKAITLHFTTGYLKGDMAVLCKQDYHVSVPFVVDRPMKPFMFPCS